MNFIQEGSKTGLQFKLIAIQSFHQWPWEISIGEQLWFNWNQFYTPLPFNIRWQPSGIRLVNRSS